MIVFFLIVRSLVSEQLKTVRRRMGPKIPPHRYLLLNNILGNKNLPYIFIPSVQSLVIIFSEHYSLSKLPLTHIQGDILKRYLDFFVNVPKTKELLTQQYLH